MSYPAHFIKLEKRPNWRTASNLRALALLDKVIKKYNPCGFHTVDGKVKCHGFNGPCCTGCSNLTSKGCGIVAPSCRFWFCGEARDKMPTKVMRLLRRLASLWAGPMYWRANGPVKNGVFYGGHRGGERIDWHTIVPSENLYTEKELLSDPRLK